MLREVRHQPSLVLRGGCDGMHGAEGMPETRHSRSPCSNSGGFADWPSAASFGAPMVMVSERLSDGGLVVVQSYGWPENTTHLATL